MFPLPALERLKQIGFTEQNGLVNCDEWDKAESVEILLLDEARKLGASAVLFRRYYRNDEEQSPYKSEPSVYIFEEEKIKEIDKIALHAKLWSAGKCDVYIVLSQTQIDIFNARRPAEVVRNELDKNELDLKNLILASEAVDKFNDQRFSAYLFGNGTFWEQSEHQAHLDEKYNPYIHLLDYLMYVRKEFTEGKNKLSLKAGTIDKLLILSILVKFLEEIKDDNGTHTLYKIYQKYKIDSFSQALREGKILAILDDLATEFNGKVFELSTEIKQELKDQSFPLLGDFLEGNIDIKKGGQLFLWKQYDFKYLPAEVISAIYENFIQAEAKRDKQKTEKGEAKRDKQKTEKGVVYTPVHLVQLLIDEVMPLDKSKEYFSNEVFKVLDPSCGSGVFLVAAYKRMLQWWAINNSSKNNIQYPQAKEAQRIMEDNIYGVDVHPTATLVSIFGLTTALLEKLTPQEVWNKLKFKDLSQNIQNKSFFEWATTASKDFDLVIGNPPFNIEEGKKKEDILHPDLLEKINLRHKDIPNNNFALHFFEAAMTLTKKVCMIIPSNVLLYSKGSGSQNYRKAIFTDFTIQKIYDFTHLRRDLFHKTADTPVVALIVENKASEFQSIEHIVVKRILSSEKKIRFEIDYYDCHNVPWNWAIDETKTFVWKCNLLGGGRLFHLIYRLSLVPTLADFIKKHLNWREIRGFEGGNKHIIEGQDRILGIKENGEPQIQHDMTITSDNFKDKFMYEPPFMIIDQVLGGNCLPVCFIPKNNTFTEKSRLYYNRDFVGISVSENDESSLKNIYELITSRKNENLLNFQLYILAISSSCMISHETAIRQGEITVLPIPQNEEYLQLSPSEQIIQDDVLNYYIHLGKSLNKGGAELYQKADDNLLIDYGKAFCELINPIHTENEMFWQIGNVYKTPEDGFIAYQFVFGKEKVSFPFEICISNREELYKQFEILITNTVENSGTIFQRVLRWYGNTEEYDYVVFIKPNAKRYWLKSIALRDSDEMFWDYFEAGY